MSVTIGKNERDFFFEKKLSEKRYKPSDMQVGGTHYKGLEYQPINFFMDINCNTALSYALKYLSRYPNKNPDDLDKAVHCVQLYSEWLIEKLSNKPFYIPSNQLDYKTILKFTSQFEPSVGIVMQKILALTDTSDYYDIESDGTYTFNQYSLDTEIVKVTNAIKGLQK